MLKSGGANCLMYFLCRLRSFLRRIPHVIMTDTAISSSKHSLFKLYRERLSKRVANASKVDGVKTSPTIHPAKNVAHSFLCFDKCCRVLFMVVDIFMSILFGL